MNRKHGHAAVQTPTYNSWLSMIQRCENRNRRSFRFYGALGITVCDRWRHSFADFLQDMGVRPVGRTLDRVDTTGNYEPNNCRWATRSEQEIKHGTS